MFIKAKDRISKQLTGWGDYGQRWSRWE